VLRSRISRNPELLAALALVCLYIALMNGHLQSIDGLTVYRQGLSIAYDHSFHFSSPLWWGAAGTTSKFGLGLSLLYLPGLLLFSGLHPLVPLQHGFTYDFALLYADPLYMLAGPPVQILVAAAAAYLVARFIRLLGYSQGTALWGLAFFGLASPAIVYARGDVAQPLVGLCWIAALYAALRYRRTGRPAFLLACAGAQFYAVLTRPVEGALLLPTLLLLLLPGRWPERSAAAVWREAGTVVAGFLLGVVITLLVNWARYGSPLTTGYEGEGWTAPLAIGLIGSLVSPGRGLIWEFPAALLVPLGFRQLWRSDQRRAGLALGGLSLLQLINVAAWHDWWGGWNWGLRLFVPALPLVAVMAGVGLTAIAGAWRRRAAVLATAAGLLWVLPCVVTDLLGGYGGAYAGAAASFRPSAYPPIGAWAFFHHWRATGVLDSAGADILWMRLARSTHNLSLVAPAVLLAAAGLLARSVAGLSSPSPAAPSRVRLPIGSPPSELELDVRDR
jgi:hypothetical protein